MKEGLTFVIFGGTGDLAKRKLAPAFAELIHDGVLNKDSTLIGISRTKLSDKQYRKMLMDSISGKKEKNHFKQIRVRYLQMDFSKISEIKKLQKALPFCEAYGCNRIYYLATSFKLFPGIVKGLNKCGLLSKKDKFNRIVFEKPFGEDLKSSDKLNKQICSVVKEKHIFRIDHYLGKESVQNITAMKFSNNKFWKLMNNKNIKSIELRVDEELGVGNRLGYYDDFGAIKDMIQNHLLQVISLLLMECPKKLTAKYMHDEKIKVLKKLNVLPAKNHLIGQYKSYSKEIKKLGKTKSKTETFAKIALTCKNKRWRGVPIYLRTGKKLERKHGCITITFRDKNSQIVINLQPSQEIKIILKGKRHENIDFCPKCKFLPNSPDAYSVLLRDIIKDDKTMFVSGKEVHEAWKIVDKIEKIKNKIKFIIYADCTDPEA